MGEQYRGKGTYQAQRAGVGGEGWNVKRQGIVDTEFVRLAIFTLKDAFGVCSRGSALPRPPRAL